MGADFCRFQPDWFHCPLNVPVALQSSSKSGSTSVGRWALQMDFPKGRDFACLGGEGGVGVIKWDPFLAGIKQYKFMVIF